MGTTTAETHRNTERTQEKYIEKAESVYKSVGTQTSEMHKGREHALVPTEIDFWLVAFGEQPPGPYEIGIWLCVLFFI